LFRFGEKYSVFVGRECWRLGWGLYKHFFASTSAKVSTPSPHLFLNFAKSGAEDIKRLKAGFDRAMYFLVAAFGGRRRTNIPEDAFDFHSPKA
jgi:hypothetical protein